MPEQVLWQEIDNKDRTFKLVGDLKHIAEQIQPLIGVADDHDYYGLSVCTSGFEGERFTAAERAADEQVLLAILQIGETAEGWKQWFEQIPYKKNGTFHKGRVMKVYRARTYSHLWEDSYGWNAPEISITVVNDFTARLEFTSRVEKWA